MAKHRGSLRRRSSRDDVDVIRRVLESTQDDVLRAEGRSAGKAFKRDLNFAIAFAKHMGAEVARALEPQFPGIVSGEKPSRALRGMKRVDVKYSTAEAGLGLAFSFKSVHFGERDSGNRDFIHNLKRNDEELRVEATGHHLRQPFAVMVAVVFLPFESCMDATTTAGKSSFGSWVEYLWPLKGRRILRTGTSSSSSPRLTLLGPEITGGSVEGCSV